MRLFHNVELQETLQQQEPGLVLPAIYQPGMTFVPKCAASSPNFESRSQARRGLLGSILSQLGSRLQSG